MNIKIYLNAKSVIERSSIALLATVDDKGMPHIKAMLVARFEGIKNIYFCSNVSSKRFKQITNNENACIYFFDKRTFEGVCLYGKAEVKTDKETLLSFWEEGMKIYYPNGIYDDDYCVIKFTSERCNYYNNLINTDFDIITEGDIDA